MPLLSRNRDRDRRRASSPPQKRRPARLPEYEPPSCPLNNDARKALTELSKNTDARKYEEQLKQSTSLLTNSVRDINDRYVKKKEELNRLRKQQRNQGDENGENDEANKRQKIEEEALTRLREAVPSLTTQCDAAVREVIDLRIELEDGRQAVKDVILNAQYESASNANKTQEQLEGGEMDEDGDPIMRKSHREILGPLHMWRNEKEKAAADYASRSLQERYATDNDYIGFKRMWWDAVHSLDHKPIPDSSKWFTSNTAGGEDGEEEDQEEEEEEVVIAQEHISIYCPLSMVIMDEPYTSTTCKHSFNKSAITMFLRSQPNQTAQCPQTGCGKDISLKDLYDDQVMLRRINREVQRRNGDIGDADDGDEAESESEPEPESDGEV
ncbi:hypothetical protein GGR50DRAFT_140750 [Xylaria sp. CBS 124048]|nr:hypothetical protein GGR50DRAFT_140750 [Xylaria sp. CBS 124048]